MVIAPRKGKFFNLNISFVIYNFYGKLVIFSLFGSLSDAVKPRRPLVKDPNLDYDVDSDEEWEEVATFWYDLVVNYETYELTFSNSRKSQVKVSQILRRTRMKWLMKALEKMTRMKVMMASSFLMGIFQKMRYIFLVPAFCFIIIHL